MQRALYIFLLAAGLVFSIGVVRHFDVLAQDAAVAVNNTTLEAYLQKNNCASRAGVLLPYTRAVLVDLGKYTLVEAATIEEVLYEMKFIYQSPIPFNFVVFDKTYEAIYCDLPDFVIPQFQDLWNNNRIGGYIVGYVGDIKETQQVLSRFPVESIYLADLVLRDEKIALGNVRRCQNTFCKNSVRDRVLFKRPVQIVTTVDYPKVLDPLKEYSVVVTIKNISTTPIVPHPYVSLWVRQRNPDVVSALYNKSWYSVSVPVLVNDDGYIYPGQEVTKEFKIGPFIKPGEYSTRFGVYYGDRFIANSGFEVKVRVKKGNFTLGYIRGRDLDYVNVRSAPSLNAPVKFKLDVGEYVVVNKVDGAWVSITTKLGKTGWVYRPLITIYD